MPPKSIATYFKPAGAAGVAGAAAVSPAASRKRVAEPAAAPLAPAKKTKATPAKATKAKPGSAVGQVPTIALPAATTRAQLKKALVEHPDTEALLSLELESIGEDWLLALQDELTKPYFLKVSCHSGAMLIHRSRSSSRRRRRPRPRCSPLVCTPIVAADLQRTISTRGRASVRSRTCG
jgi:hypothetical protein